jgi:sugar lactone lactonase YvrE
MRHLFSSQTRSLPRRPRASRARHMNLERLEERQLLTALSISDASAIEGSGALKLIDRFVAEGSGGLATPRGSSFGPDGNHDGAQDLYVASANTNSILRYDGVTGSFMDTFVTPASGGLNSPADLAFGPDGDLYVSSYAGNQVLRYDGSSGVFLNVVTSGLASPLGITFGSNGSLYIANQDTNQVLRYDNSGLSVFVAAGSGGLSQPRRGVFGPDGNLYVASQGTGQVLRYNGLSGAFIDAFATTGPPSTQGPMWLDFGTDGYLYTTVRNSAVDLGVNIARFNGSTGAFVDSFALANDGWSFQIGPGNVVYSSGNAFGNHVDRFGPSSLAAFTVGLDAVSGSQVTVNYSTADGSAVAGIDYVQTSGTVTFAPGETTKTILVNTMNDTIADSTQTFTVNLSSPVGATITHGQGVASISDDATKFYVVNDGSSLDQTYKYGGLGSSLGNSALNGGDTAPRGDASTAAGTKVWLVDANKHVYVYNPGGGLLGAWTAGSLSSNARVEGIATDGTDVWIVDAYQHKVYRYANAAGRLSGSQNAASSFSLNSNDTNPKDMVTDGANFWVVDDGTSTDKVYKYALSGSLAGSWTLNAGTSPTGITLDPTNVSNLWIVDTATSRVYQYDNAAGLTSGSQSPSRSFALAAGNTNPQGIADPPAPTSGASRATAFTTPSDSAAELAAHHGRTIADLWTLKSAGSTLMLIARTPLILGRQETPILLLAPPSDQDLSLLATEHLRSGTKRAVTPPRG